MAGEHDDAISRIDDLIDTERVGSMFYVVQAHMHLLLGNSRMENRDYTRAIRSFECARVQFRPHASRALAVVSLISGWNFDDLEITVRQRLCEALYAAGSIKEAGESLLNIVNTVDEDAYMTGPIITWVSDFLQRYLSTPADSVDATLHPPSPMPLLREWAKSKLTSGSWRDALVVTLNVSISFCFGAHHWFDTPLVWSLQPRDSRFIVLSVTISK
jgi:hypothetical protein